MERVLEILRRLRAPDGCPWDRKQTHESLRSHLLEEAAEAVDALAAGDDAAITEELGDVLLHVAFHAVIAEERVAFDYRRIEEALIAKLVRRHPHVFGDTPAASDAHEVEGIWAEAKAAETGKGARTRAERVPHSLPALARAAALAQATELPEPPGALARLAAGAADGAATERDLADALLAIAVRARRQGLDPELLLRDRLREIA